MSKMCAKHTSLYEPIFDWMQRMFIQYKEYKYYNSERIV